jgi:retron-type reverse transcriptase
MINCVHTYEDIISIENLLLAWKEFVKGKRKRKDLLDFERNLMTNIILLHSDLSLFNYKHSKYQAFKISDPKSRDIHKASIRDRLLHHAIYRKLYPYFDKKFIFDSYSCRNRKGTHRAINRFEHFYLKCSKNNTKTCWVLKCDIRKFFATIDHNILISILDSCINDKNLVTLLKEIISSFHSNSKISVASCNNVGLPLGNLTSQLFVNIYMNEFDHFVKRELKVLYYIRYADDFIFLSENKSELEDILQKVVIFLKEKLSSSLNFSKVHISTYSSGIDFLGWVNFPYHRTLRTVTKKRMKRRIEEIDSIATKASYIGLLSHGDTYTLLKEIFY